MCNWVHNLYIMLFLFADKKISYKLKKIKILSGRNLCVHITSITVYTQKQTSCVTLNYEAVTSLFSSLFDESVALSVGIYTVMGPNPTTYWSIRRCKSYLCSGICDQRNVRGGPRHLPRVPWWRIHFDSLGDKKAIFLPMTVYFYSKLMYILRTRSFSMTIIFIGLSYKTKGLTWS